MQTTFTVNNIEYTADPATRTITPADEFSTRMMATLAGWPDTPVGPGVDEFFGITASWGQAPLSILWLAHDLADSTGVTFTANIDGLSETP